MNDVKDQKKLPKLLLPAIVALLAVGLLFALFSTKSAGEGSIVGGGKVRPVAYNDAMKPAPGTQMFNMEIKDGKLVSGPSTIHSVLNGAFKIDVTAHTKAAELEFYVDHYSDNSEIDYTPDGQKDVLTGQVYVLTDTRGTFHYGVEDEKTNTKYPLGTLIVE